MNLFDVFVIGAAADRRIERANLISAHVSQGYSIQEATRIVDNHYRANPDFLDILVSLFFTVASIFGGLVVLFFAYAAIRVWVL